MRVLAEIIASDVSLLVIFNQATEGVIQNNPTRGGSARGSGVQRGAQGSNLDLST